MDITSWPFYDEEQINAAKNVLSSGKVNKWTGTECSLFEKNIAVGVVQNIQFQFLMDRLL